MPGQDPDTQPPTPIIHSPRGPGAQHARGPDPEHKTDDSATGEDTDTATDSGATELPGEHRVEPPSTRASISPQDARALQRRTPLLRQPERGMKRIRNRVFARRHPSFPPRDRRGHRCVRCPRCPPKPRPQTQATYPGAKTRLSRPDMSPVGVAMVPGTIAIRFPIPRESEHARSATRTPHYRESGSRTPDRESSRRVRCLRAYRDAGQGLSRTLRIRRSRWFVVLFDAGERFLPHRAHDPRDHRAHRGARRLAA